MAEKEYLIRLGERARKRHYHETDKGHVVTFMVQLEVEVEDGLWKAVIRYDCAHDFAHRDRYNLKGDHDKEEIPLSYTDHWISRTKTLTTIGMFTRNAF